MKAYTWPIGIVTRWLRAVAVGAPGIFSRVGLGTFIDPRQDGGFLNELARERRSATVEPYEVHGREYLLYRFPRPNVALVRATTGDEIGNLSMDQEGIYGSVLSVVEAVEANPGGVVIAQALRTVTLGEIHPKHVVVPGPLVDCIVVTRRGLRWRSTTGRGPPSTSTPRLGVPHAASPSPTPNG